MKIIVNIRTMAGGLGAVGTAAEGYPVEMVWQYEVECGDNPAFYADNLQKAIKDAAYKAVAKLDALVVQRDRP